MRRKGLVLPSLAVAFGLIGYAVFREAHPSPGPFDKEAAQRIRKLCGSRTDCQVRLHDLSERDWDTFYSFGPGTTDETVTRALGTGISLDHDLERAVVLTKHGHIVFSAAEIQGVEHPIAGQVDILCGPPNQPFVRCSSDALLQVDQGTTEGDPARGFGVGGPHYTLTEVR